MYSSNFTWTTVLELDFIQVMGSQQKKLSELTIHQVLRRQIASVGPEVLTLHVLNISERT